MTSLQLVPTDRPIEAELNRAFDVRRGGVTQMFGLDAWKAGILATLTGHMINRKIGDAWTLPTP